jgi:hypothetical protein
VPGATLRVTSQGGQVRTPLPGLVPDRHGACNLQAILLAAGDRVTRPHPGPADGVVRRLDEQIDNAVALGNRSGRIRAKVVARDQVAAVFEKGDAVAGEAIDGQVLDGRAARRDVLAVATTV